MLQFDPRRRIGVVDALEHPWLAEMHDPTTEATAPGTPLEEWIWCIGLPVPINSGNRVSSWVVDIFGSSFEVGLNIRGLIPIQ